MLMRKTMFWISVALAIGVFSIIFVLTEQTPVQTSALSSAVNEAVVARHDNGMGDGAAASPNAEPTASSGVISDLGTALLSYASVRKWAHTVEFLAFGIPVSLAFIFWWGKPHGLLSRVPPAFLLCVFASLFDQTHKLFVPGREFDAGDLLFDLLGYSIAILACFACDKIARTIRGKQHSALDAMAA